MMKSTARFNNLLCVSGLLLGAAPAGAAEPVPQADSVAMRSGSGLAFNLISNPTLLNAGETGKADSPPGLFMAVAGKTAVTANMISHYDPIVLGQICLPDQPGLEPAVAENDSTRRVYEIRGKEAEALPDDFDLSVTVSRLTPALLIEAHACAVALFSGDKSMNWIHLNRDATFANGPRRTDTRAWANFAFLKPPRAPRHYAASDGRSVAMGMLGSTAKTFDGVENGWLLLWNGADSWFMTGETTMAKYMNWQPWRQGDTRLVPGDAPMLLLCSHPPTVRMDMLEGLGPTGEVVLEFDEPAVIALLPLFGYVLPPAEQTAQWVKDKALPDAVVKRCDWWASHLAHYPVSAEETFRYEPGADTVVNACRFTYKDVRAGGAAHAPLPPMLELARRKGFPVEIGGTISDSGAVTYCGPYAVLENADAYEARFTGLGKYIWERPAPSAPAQADEALRRELEMEIDRMLAAGHLAPVSLPYKHSFWWTPSPYSTAQWQLFSAPGRALSSLASALPFLDSERQARVKSYMADERREYPPEYMVRLPYDKGARREPGFVPQRQIELIAARPDKVPYRFHWTKSFHDWTKTVPAEALYDLACYYEAVGPEAMAADGFDLNDVMEGTLLPWFRRTEWATQGWFSWPQEMRDSTIWGSYGYNMPHDINRLLAAQIGAARLARLAGDPDIEARAVTQAVRTMAHRFAVGKYVAWLYEQGGFLLVPDGFLPANDARAPTVTEDCAMIGPATDTRPGGGFWFVLPGRAYEEGPYACLVPETARFCADFLKPEAETFTRLCAAFYPDAYMTLGSARHMGEWWHNYPEDSRLLFMLHAWVLGTPGKDLRGLLDVPIVPVGDLYHIEKLVAALTADAGCQWLDVRESAP